MQITVIDGGFMGRGRHTNKHVYCRRREGPDPAGALPATGARGGEDRGTPTRGGAHWHGTFPPLGHVPEGLLGGKAGIILSSPYDYLRATAAVTNTSG